LTKPPVFLEVTSCSGGTSNSKLTRLIRQTCHPDICSSPIVELGPLLSGHIPMLRLAQLSLLGSDHLPHLPGSLTSCRGHRITKRGRGHRITKRAVELQTKDLDALQSGVGSWLKRFGVLGSRWRSRWLQSQATEHFLFVFRGQLSSLQPSHAIREQSQESTRGAHTKVPRPPYIIQRW